MAISQLSNEGSVNLPTLKYVIYCKLMHYEVRALSR